MNEAERNSESLRIANGAALFSLGFLVACAMGLLLLKPYGEKPIERRACDLVIADLRPYKACLDEAHRCTTNLEFFQQLYRLKVEARHVCPAETMTSEGF